MSLFSRFRGPTRAEFDREVLPHLDSLYSTALRLTRNDKDAEDLVQDAALRAFRFFHQFEQGSNVRAWLFKILHNTFLTRYRRNTREREVMEGVGHEEEAGTAGTVASPVSATPEDTMLANLLSDDVRGALERIPEDFRNAVVMCDLEDFSYKEIADILECPVGTVMSRLHRGRRLLQVELRTYAALHGIGDEKNRKKKPDASAEGKPEKLATVIPIRRSEP